jgi:hypothetical protein
MMRHRAVRNLLYDYLRTDMDPALKHEVESHLTGCETCSRDLRAVTAVLNALVKETETVESSREQSEWNALHASIMRRIESGEDHRTSLWPEFIFWIRSVAARPRYAVAAGMVAALIGLLWFMKSPTADREQLPVEAIQAPAPEPMELGRYFRKSRALLTGLSNLDPPPDAPIDLSVEREISRQLIIEGRSLQGGRLDPRSNRLISDVDRIMERVSSAAEEARPPDIQAIRSDIRGQNLLVKLRVAEASYSAGPARQRGEGL